MGQQLPRRALVWVIFIMSLGAVALLYGVKQLFASGLSVADQLSLALFAIAVLAADFYRIRLISHKFTITVSTVVVFAAALVFGFAAVPLAVMGGVADVMDRRPFFKTAFNVGIWAVATLASVAVWEMMNPARLASGLELLTSPQATFAWIMAGLVFVCVNAGGVFIVVALAEGTSIWYIVKGALEGIVVQLLTLPTLGVLAAVLYREAPASLIVVTLPLIAVYYSLQAAERVKQETRATIERLSDILDKRDPATEQHSQRVADYSALVCDRMGLPTDFHQTVVLAARIHDLGKIGIPDKVLFKPGRLNDEEWEIIKRHAPDGAEIVSGMKAYSAAVEIIRHHHERWDGKGYPDGLKGADIPLGARIVAVCDTYDAMISSRPYRTGIEQSTVLEEIRRQAGAQFDPDVARAFLMIMAEQRGEQVESMPGLDLKLRPSR